MAVDASGTTTAAMAEAHSNGGTSAAPWQHKAELSTEPAKLQRGHLPTVYPTRIKSELGGAELAAASCPVAMETDGKGPVPSTTTKLPGTCARPRWRASGWT